MKYKKVTKSGGITIPRVLRQESGLFPGVPVDISAGENGILISKHIPACCCCGTVEEVQIVCDLEICRNCAGKIAEVFQ